MPNIDPGPLTTAQDVANIGPLSDATIPSSFSGGGGFSLAGASFSGLGSAVSSIFGGIGDLKEAKAYSQAAQYATINAGIAKEEERIQLSQTNRQIERVLGQQQAGYASAGLQASGSALNVIRASAQQGALQKAIVQEQGQINVTGYLEQAAQYSGMASAAKAAGIGGIAGGILGGIGAIFSDERLKEAITYSYTRPDGINVYTFRYKGAADTWSGVVAQDVQRVRPDAVGVEDGYLTVDYDKLGLLPLRVA